MFILSSADKRDDARRISKKIRDITYRCDICQLVYPYNQGKDFHLHEEVEPEMDEVYPKLKPMLSMSNEDSRQQFRHLTSSWRGKKPLQRNALITLADLGDRTALPKISECLTDIRPVIRETTAWIIRRLGTKEPEKWLDVLGETLAKESREVVINGLEHAQELLRGKLK